MGGVKILASSIGAFDLRFPFSEDPEAVGASFFLVLFGDLLLSYDKFDDSCSSVTMYIVRMTSF
jgi:hypothetical protein